MKKGSLLTVLFGVGGCLVLVGVVSFLFRLAFSPYIYIIGSVMIAVAQIVPQKVLENDVTVRRLYKQRSFGALFLVASGFLMLYAHHNEWILCLAIGALIQLYTSFRLPK